MIAQSSLTYGVAGCGVMGLPMAKALGAAGFEVYGFDVRPVDEFGDFSSRMIGSAEGFSNKCDVVVCVVRDEKQILDLCFEQQALFAVERPPRVLVISSTVSPRFITKLRQKLASNVVLVDAPMSGTNTAAISATLTFMVGGPDDAVEELQPAFKAMGEKIYHLGKLGHGMTAKVLNNFVAATTVVAVRDVISQAKLLGLEQDALLEVMDKSSGQTFFGTNFERIYWAGEPYDPANTIGILEKDVRSYIDVLENGAEPLHEAVVSALRTLPPISD